MNLSKIEKKILQQLSTNGAATVHELTEAIACSLSGVQSAMRTLRAADLIRPHDLKHVPGMYKRIRTYVTNTTHTIADENPLLDRVVKLEDAFKNLTEIHNRMVIKYSEYTKNVSHFGGKTEQLDRWFGDHEVWLTSLDNRIRALEPAVTPVDPIYAEIEEWVRTTLGGKDVPEEALRSIIDGVYAKRTK
jgi:predicted transcriptional regulator